MRAVTGGFFGANKRSHWDLGETVLVLLILAVNVKLAELTSQRVDATGSSSVLDVAEWKSAKDIGMVVVDGELDARSGLCSGRHPFLINPPRKGPK
jgi:hypothetical protein